MLIAPDNGPRYPQGGSIGVTGNLFATATFAVGGVPQSPLPTWSTTGPITTAFAPPAAATPGPGQAVVTATGSGSATLSAGNLTLPAFVYRRFSLGCLTSTATVSATEFPSGITFAADGTLAVAATPAQADLAFIGNRCPGPFNSTTTDGLTYPGNGVAFVSPQTYFAPLRAGDFQASSSSIDFATLQRVNYGIPIVLKTRTGVLVKVLITERLFDTDNSSRFISGGYEVAGTSPADGF
ncbi:MAG: hypothetical protein NVS2B17_06920 [Candidatus Velthaea sp.]